jgi:hypothetical protein
VLAIVLASCASRPAPVEAPPAAPPSNERLELLSWVEGLGLPSVLGWTRVERVTSVDHEGRPVCRRGWVQERGAHRIFFDDWIDIDYDGFWFAQWPAHMRVSVDEYAKLRNRLHRKSRHGRRDEFLAERPSDLLAEVTRSLQGTERCGDPPRDAMIPALTRASWVRAHGHEELARKLVDRWHPAWDVEDMRDLIADRLLDLAIEGLRQGMPRARVRPLLETVRSSCACKTSEHAAVLLAHLGDDPSEPIDPDDPATFVPWIADDLVFPSSVHRAMRRREEVGWGPEVGPRSPALELVRMEWSALPTLLDRPWPDRLMRTNTGRIDSDGRMPLRTTNIALREIVSLIARRRFDDDAEMRAWWERAQVRGETASLESNLVESEYYLQESTERLIELDPGGVVASLQALWPRLDEGGRVVVVQTIVDAVTDEDEPFDPARITGLRELLHTAVRERSPAMIAAAGEGLLHLGDRTWTKPASRRVRAAMRELELAEGDDDDDDFDVYLALVAIAEADPRRGVGLLREARRQGGTVRRELVLSVLEALCEPSDDEPVQHCHGAVREMYAALPPEPE